MTNEKRKKEKSMHYPFLFKIRIKKHKIFKEIFNMYIMEPQVMFEEMIKIKNDQPKDLYGYYIRFMLQSDTYNLKKGTAMKAIEGIPRKYLMSKIEMKQYKELPETITIYRGTSDMEYDPRFSWSLDVNTAKRFYQGALLSATIEKKQIIALFSDNTTESEVIVNLDINQVKQIV